MNSRIKRLLAAARAKNWIPRALVLGLLALVFAGWLIADEQRSAPDLTVHEWGTFTAVAGSDGQAIEWTPFVAPGELPDFVEHVSAANLKAGLRGTIRMETPVLYFYSPRDVTVSVKAVFRKGVITEWYPHAAHVQPTGVLRNVNLNSLQSGGSIAWERVAISPNTSLEFPRDSGPNRYYALRETSSTPLRVNTPKGGQQEKFLFYRGVSAASLPLSAAQTADGKLLVQSLSGDDLPAVILFEHRGERVGYRVVHSPGNKTVLDPPALTDGVDSLCADLESILIDQGLYPDEAHAMVETWRDSWFEEGSRLIYIVPRGFIDHVLPLTINPAPGQIVRVFVGRMEIVTPATARAVETAVASNDEATLSKYSRFLEPILRVAKQTKAGVVRQYAAGSRPSSWR
jgi:hypothetical protein